MINMKNIIKSIRRTNNKDSNAYKVTEYYLDLTEGCLDAGGISIARAKVLNILKIGRRNIQLTREPLCSPRKTRLL
jgi:hypothetical protein